jgi:hypothetical protein
MTEQALIPTEGHAPAAGAAAVLASLDDATFRQRLDLLKIGRERVQEMQRSLMKQGVDYGQVGNTTKPTLLKPGAELLCGLYGLVADFDAKVAYPAEGPAIRALTVCYLHIGNLNGPIVAVGYGAANTWEKRYRYRRARRVCPACGVVGALFKGGKDSKLQGRWWDGPRDGGCGETFDPDDPRIIGQVTVEDNPDPFELENTIVKMAEKRSYVDATLRATATSGLFTQDIEDFVRSDAAPDPDDEAAAAFEAAQNAPQPAGDAQVATDTAAVPATPAQAVSAPVAAPQPAASNRRGAATATAPAQPPANGAAKPAQAYRPVTTDPAKCPKHNRPWRSGARGWYCSAKDDSGPRGYCELKPGATWAAQAERTVEVDPEAQAFAR